MRQQLDPTLLTAVRSALTGLRPDDLRAIERNPFDRRCGFALAERVAGSGDSAPAQIFAAIAEVLGDDGAPCTDAGFGADTLHAIAAAFGGRADRIDDETDLPAVRDVRVAAEAAGLLERRKRRAHLTSRGRALATEDALDGVVPQLLRGWARRPIDAHTPFVTALHATWPLTIVLLRRFGRDWLPIRFYVDAVAQMAPEVVAAADPADPETAFETFANAYVIELLLRFAAFYGLAEVAIGDDPDDDVGREPDGASAEPSLRATPLLEALLPLRAHQAPASARSGDGDEPSDNPAAATNRALADALAEQRFESEDDVQTFIADFMAERNAAPIADFDGLSAEQMQRLLSAPFTPGGVLTVAEVPRAAPPSPCLHLMLDLAAALGDDGLKATAKGNLPLAYVQAAAQRFQATAWRCDSIERIEHARTEWDFSNLYITRLVARMAGLVSLRRGRWNLTQKYRRTFERHGAAGVYAQLFRTFVARYAWNSADGYPELGIIQTSWAFSLLLLLRYGDTWRDGGFYADRFVRAFPMALDEAAHALANNPWQRDPETVVRDAYDVRVLQRFAAFLGLAEVEHGRSIETYGRTLRVRATPALADVLALAGP